MDQIVIVAVDHSAQAEDTVRYYLEKMHRHGNKLMLVHCIELPELTRNHARDCHISVGVLAAMWKEEEAKSRILENKMKQLLMNKGVSAKLRSCAGKPGEMLCRIAEEHHAAYIVTGARHGGGAGSRGVSGVGAVIQRTLLGDVSEYLLKHSCCPVVMCRDAETVGRQRRASEVKNKDLASKRSRHASMKERSASFASNLRRRFASGGKSGGAGAMSLDIGGSTFAGSSGGAESIDLCQSVDVEDICGTGDAGGRVGSMDAVDLPALFQRSIQLYPVPSTPQRSLSESEATTGSTAIE